jgi:hypothetical protein
LVLCSGVALSSSAEESEEMYSGTSSVPRISLGSKSRLNRQRGVNHEIAIKEQEKNLKENSLSNGTLLW